MTDNDNKKILTKEERNDKLIQKAYDKLIETYLNSNHRKNTGIIERSFNFAKQAHKGVFRLSGEPYILHSIAVAQIVCEEIGLGSTSISAALLHDVEEDTDYTNEDISNLFGPRIANIVEGLTKISGGIFGDRASVQAETFKKLLIMMSDDARIILIKIADRLHNMRTLASMRPSKQYKIAGETLYIYAPLADRLGFNAIKTELEDLSFKYEHKVEYKKIEDKLEETKNKREEIFNTFTPPICEALDKMGYQYKIYARIKTPYSIWKKMQKKHLEFEDIYDILATRIVFQPHNIEEEKSECYAIYMAITKLYRSHPERRRDWLETPKANGYQALHGTFMSRLGEWVEVQIRSKRMDAIAENGVAAHWKYKRSDPTYKESNNYEVFFNGVKDVLNSPQPDTLDLLDSFQLQLQDENIIVFTPAGDMITLPQDSTVLDFAFSVHSVLGEHCIGAKVNHKLVSFDHKLRSGDQVEVLTSKNQQPKPEWIDLVKTGKAKTKIEGVLRTINSKNRKKGEKVLQEFLKVNDFDFSSENINKLCDLHNYIKRPELFLLIGNGELKLGERELKVLRGKTGIDIWSRFIRLNKKNKTDKKNYEDELSSENEDLDFEIDKRKTFVIKKENIAHTSIAKCCSPIPGDEVLGLLDSENHLTIHKRSCEEILKEKSQFGHRIVAVDFHKIEQNTFPTPIYIEGIDATGLVADISNIINKTLGLSFNKIEMESYNNIFKGNIYIKVHDVEEVKKVCNTLEKHKNIKKAIRYITSEH